jgi:Uma2 family endonuclease
MDTIVLKGEFTQSFSDEEFFKFCMDNPDLRIERDSNLQIVIMSPVGSKFGFFSGAAFAQLSHWSVSTHQGFAFDSSTGFTMPDRSVLSPDASWISKERWRKLSEEERNRFAPICPDFIIEVRSKSDRLYELQKKMEQWIRNGAQLAWLIDPIDEVVFIYRKQGEMEMIKGFDQLVKGDGPVQGLTLDLSQLEMRD